MTLTHCALFPEGRCAELNRLFCPLPHRRSTEAAKQSPRSGQERRGDAPGWFR